MSCFVLDDINFAFLAHYVNCMKRINVSVEDFASELKKANLLAYCERYSEPFVEGDSICSISDNARFLVGDIQAQRVLSIAYCFNYQAVNWSDYRTSNARDYFDLVIRTAINKSTLNCDDHNVLSDVEHSVKPDNIHMISDMF